MKRHGNIFFVLMMSLALNLLRAELTGATKEDVEEKFSSIKSEMGEDDELALLAANEIESDLFRPEDIPIVCRLIFAGAAQNPIQVKRNFHPWKGKRLSPVEAAYARQQLRMDSLVKKGGFNPWGGKRQLYSEVGENRIVTKNEPRIPRTQSFNPWGG